MSTKTKLEHFRSCPLCRSISLSNSLLECSFSELALSLDERKKPVICLEDTHYSVHAAGSMVLLAAGFDAWLNEGIGTLSIIEKDVIDLSIRPTKEKYYGIINTLKGSIPANNDLDLFIKLRDEIVHYLPRISPTGKGPRNYIPQKFWALDKRGLLLIPSTRNIEIPFGQQICSYKLAYWAWETVDAAAVNFIKSFESTIRPEYSIFYSAIYNNFNFYKKIAPPDALKTYDAKWGIELSNIQ